MASPLLHLTNPSSCWFYIQFLHKHPALCVPPPLSSPMAHRDPRSPSPLVSHSCFMRKSSIIDEESISLLYKKTSTSW